MMVFALAFLYDAFRTGKMLTRQLWRGYSALQGLYFTALITYHVIIAQRPQIDILNGLLIIGSLMFFIILRRVWTQVPQKGRLFAPPLASYYLAFLYASLPISRILPPETDAPIYHHILYVMAGVFILRLMLDLYAALRRKAAAK